MGPTLERTQMMKEDLRSSKVEARHNTFAEKKAHWKFKKQQEKRGNKKKWLPDPNDPKQVQIRLQKDKKIARNMKARNRQLGLEDGRPPPRLAAKQEKTDGYQPAKTKGVLPAMKDGIPSKKRWEPDVTDPLQVRIREQMDKQKNNRSNGPLSNELAELSEETEPNGYKDIFNNEHTNPNERTER